MHTAILRSQVNFCLLDCCCMALLPTMFQLQLNELPKVARNKKSTTELGFRYENTRLKLPYLELLVGDLIRLLVNFDSMKRLI
jgi:hypothetical protein